MFPRLASSSVAGILSERRHLLHYSLETGGGRGGGGGDLVVKEEEEEDVVTTGWFGWSGKEKGRKSSPVSLSLPEKESVYSILLLTLQGKESRRKSFGREERGEVTKYRLALAEEEEEEDASISLWGRNNTEPD